MLTFMIPMCSTTAPLVMSMPCVDKRRTDACKRILEPVETTRKFIRFVRKFTVVFAVMVLCMM